MREELRAALLDMTPRQDSVLRGCYASPVLRTGVDLENVVLYNVGSRYLRHLVRRGVIIERSYIIAAGPAVDLAHHLRYEAVDTEAGFLHWTTGDRLGSFSGVHTPRMKCAPLWAAIRTQADPPDRTYAAPVPFVLRVRVRCPRTANLEARSLPELVKDLLDGLVSAYHSHGPHDPDSEAAARLAAKGLELPAPVAAVLADPAWAALGPRRLVHLRPTGGVAWSPADDLCVAADIRFAQGTVSDQWEVDGELLTAVARSEPQAQGPLPAAPTDHAPGGPEPTSQARPWQRWARRIGRNRHARHRR